MRLAASCARRSARRSAGWRMRATSSSIASGVARPGRDHDALLREGAGVGGHRPRHAPADVGVVRAGGGEADRGAGGPPAVPADLQAGVGGLPREHGGDERDVRQVGAPREGVVEHPRQRPRSGPRPAQRRPRRASSRGARGCARPASTICPRASNSAVEQSRRSLMLGECAERISAAPISSHAARSAPVKTCSSIGSRVMRRPPRRAGARFLAHRPRPATRAARTTWTPAAAQTVGPSILVPGAGSPVASVSSQLEGRRPRPRRGS